MKLMIIYHIIVIGPYVGRSLKFELPSWPVEKNTENKSTHNFHHLSKFPHNKQIVSYEILLVYVRLCVVELEISNVESLWLYTVI